MGRTDTLSGGHGRIFQCIASVCSKPLERLSSEQ